MLLTSWIERNKKHSEKFRKWTEKVKTAESNPTYNSALQVAAEVEKANELLSKALRKLQEAE